MIKYKYDYLRMLLFIIAIVFIVFCHQMILMYQMRSTLVSRPPFRPTFLQLNLTAEKGSKLVATGVQCDTDNCTVTIMNVGTATQRIKWYKKQIDEMWAELITPSGAVITSMPYCVLYSERYSENFTELKPGSHIVESIANPFNLIDQPLSELPYGKYIVRVCMKINNVIEISNDIEVNLSR